MNPETNEISPAVKEAVRGLKTRGVTPVLVSGRPIFKIREIAKELDVDTMVGFNGGLVVSNGKVIYAKTIEPHMVKMLVEYAAQNNHGIVVPGLDGYYKNFENHPLIEEVFGNFGFDTTYFDPYYAINNDVYQLELIAPDETRHNYVEFFGKQFHFYPWHVCKSATNVNPIGISKAFALKILLSHFEVKVDESIAFGDGPNDIEMIRFAGTGIAMGNSDDDLKQAADYVTDDVRDDGVVTALQRLGLAGEVTYEHTGTSLQSNRV